VIPVIEPKIFSPLIFGVALILYKYYYKPYLDFVELKFVDISATDSPLV
jgi:hypothetical protein